MSNAAISLSPEASPGSLENGGQRTSSGSMIGRDPAEIFGTAPRGIGYADDDKVRTGVELHVTTKTPVQMSFVAGSRVVVALASITTGGSELGLGYGKVEMIASNESVLVTLDKDNPQQIVTAGGTYTFKLTHPKWYSDGAPCANVAVALAE